MTREMGFLIALCATSAVCYALLTRADRIRGERRSARTSSNSDGGAGATSATSDSWALANWFSGGHSSPCFHDSSGNPANFADCGSISDGGSGGGDCSGGASGGID